MFSLCLGLLDSENESAEHSNPRLQPFYLEARSCCLSDRVWLWTVFEECSLPPRRAPELISKSNTFQVSFGALCLWFGRNHSPYPSLISSQLSSFLDFSASNIRRTCSKFFLHHLLSQIFLFHLWFSHILKRFCHYLLSQVFWFHFWFSHILKLLICNHNVRCTLLLPMPLSSKSTG